MLLSGLPLRDKIKNELTQLVSGISVEERPKLVIIQVGNNEASNIYIKKKIEFGNDIGISVELRQFTEDVSEEEIVSFIEKLNQDSSIGGVIVQLPLPPHMDSKRVTDAISDEKDVDAFHSPMLPPTTRSILSLLNFYSIPLSGVEVLMIGNSDLVGRPTAKACEEQGAVVTVVDKETLDIPSLAKKADIIITATGKPGLITKEYVKEGQIVIDVGIVRKEGKIYGDVAIQEVLPIVKGVTPVPGGVGPLTVASLFQNLLRKYT